MASFDSDRPCVTDSSSIREKRPREFEYLCVDDFLGNIFHARALATAFESGLIDRFIRNGPISSRSLQEGESGDPRVWRLLIGLLLESRVVEDRNGRIQLTQEFSHALQFRDLLELKGALAHGAVHDFINYFSDLVYHPDQFFRKAQFLRIFSYDRCFTPSRENYDATKRWMRITTTLTKYEAQACLKCYDFGRHGNMLDIGGNSGEFSLRICRRHPGIRAAVFDLPLVCDIGRRHIAQEPEANRISFIQGNALTDPLPEGADLVTFKSMLHDWPEKEAGQFIANAGRSLAPGGTLLIFERGPLDVSEIKISYSLIPMLLFYHSFRPPTFYEERLRMLGFQEIAVQAVYLDTPFFIVTAKKGRG